LGFFLWFFEGVLEKVGVLRWYFDGQNVVACGEIVDRRKSSILRLKTCHSFEIFFGVEDLIPIMGNANAASQ
jgi:hypothetical protein